MLGRSPSLTFAVLMVMSSGILRRGASAFSSRSSAVRRPLVVGRVLPEAVAVSSTSTSASSNTGIPSLFSTTRLYQSTSAQSTESTSDISIAPRVKTADALQATDGPVTIKGWVRTLRKQKTLAFVEVNDGSNLAGIQCVVSFDNVDEKTLTELDKVTTGCAVEVTGPLVTSQGGKQAVFPRHDVVPVRGRL